MFHNRTKIIFLFLLACNSLSQAMYQRPPGRMFRTGEEFAAAIQDLQSQSEHDRAVGYGYLGAAAVSICSVLVNKQSPLINEWRSRNEAAVQYCLLTLLLTGIGCAFRGIDLLHRNRTDQAARRVAQCACPHCLREISKNPDDPQTKKFLGGWVTYAILNALRTRDHGELCAMHQALPD